MNNDLVTKLLAADCGYSPIVVKDTCRCDNGGVLSISDDSLFRKLPGASDINIAAFVLAAGASSRYINPLTKLRKSLRSGDVEQIRSAWDRIKEESNGQWALPVELRDLDDFLAGKKDIEQDRDFFSSILACLEVPKALYPCVLDRHSYLAVKAMEHESFKDIDLQIFACPPGFKESFRKEVEPLKCNLETSCIEQGESMSTIRFDLNGKPLIDRTSNTYSKVPGGHGSLVQTFPEIKKNFPDVDALFIRNIDNVCGTSRSVIEATQGFFSVFRGILAGIKGIRTSLKDGNFDGALQAVEGLYNVLTVNSSYKDRSDLSALTGNGKPESLLWRLLVDFFHIPFSAKQRFSNDELLDFYTRPFNLVGLVKNSGYDAGGTPVFASFDDTRIKICLETSHASEFEREMYLSNPMVATHFNPGFVIAELQEEATNYFQEQESFGLLARKKWNGLDVCYVETALYELLGNSKMANVLFLEISRDIFNPHKTLNDTKGRRLEDWLS
ncbi:MAG: DUF4301 family protein [Bdellovibrionota bacterium]